MSLNKNLNNKNILLYAQKLKTIFDIIYSYFKFENKILLKFFLIK